MRKHSQQNELERPKEREPGSLYSRPKSFEDNSSGSIASGPLPDAGSVAGITPLEQYELDVARGAGLPGRRWPPAMAQCQGCDAYVVASELRLLPSPPCTPEYAGKLICEGCRLDLTHSHLEARRRREVHRPILGGAPWTPRWLAMTGLAALIVVAAAVTAGLGIAAWIGGGRG